MNKILILFLFFFIYNVSNAQVFDFVVDKNGNGDYTTITDAISNIPNNSTNRTLIFIKNGDYEEKIHLPETKKNVSFIGESSEGVIFTWGDYQGKDGMYGAESYTFLSEGENFYMENITVINSYGVGSQAVAIRTTGDKQVYKNCVFKGHQDTYYAHKNRQYNFKCHVEGTVDFIYGDATAVFDSCSIHSIGGGCVTAPADSKMITQLAGDKFIHGFLFTNSNLTAASNVADNSVCLGRPWQSDASCAYINCTLGKHIKPQGWNEWDDNNHLSAVFSEYNSKNPDGTLVDVSQRVTWSKQLTEKEANTYYLSNFFLRKGLENWLAKDIAKALYAPLNVKIENDNLKWDNVDNAIGYAVYYDNKILSFTKTETIAISAPNNNLEKLKVVTINEYGAMSDGSEEVPENLKVENNLNNVFFEISNFNISFEQLVNVAIVDIYGKNLTSKKETYNLDISNIEKGVYILIIESKNGMRTSEKIIIK